MTSTERSRRHRAGLVTKSVTKSPPASVAAKDARIRELEVVAATLAAELEEHSAWARRVKQTVQEVVATWKARAAALEAELTQARKRIAELKRRGEGQIKR